MTDLTEQWRKGELPSGWYYTKLWKGCNVIDYFIGNQFLRYDDSDIEQVLAPVPSYEEWIEYQKLDEDNKRNSQLAIQFSIEVDTLKELLEECSPYVGHSAASRMIKNSAGHKKDMKLLTKIDEALK